jgi:ABC-type protease/lipase transport system fused ATPase/permease subunit
MLIGANKPDHGLIRLDGADVFDWDSDDLGRHIGYVPQVVELLPGTIRENIARFSTAAPEKVVAAAKAAGIHDLILGLPRGYDTMVGGAYDILSVGARQRLALARALFDEPQLLVLDEPYSNLDAEGVTALVTALERLKTKGATVIIVAHRPSILAHADRVLLLQDGGAKMVDKKRPATFKVLNSDGDVVDETTSGDGKAGPDSIKKGAAQ